MHFEVIPAKAFSVLIHSTPLVQSRNFNKLWNLGQTSSWFCLAIHRTTLTNPSNNLNKSMQQFRQIHVTTKRNPCINSDKYMWQLWQSKIQNEEGVNDLIKTLWFCCICFYSLLYSTLFRSKRPKIRIWDHEWRWQAWPQMMTAILGPSSHHLCSHLSLSFANLGVNFQLLGCHSLILTIKMIASYMYQNVGVRGVKKAYNFKWQKSLKYNRVQWIHGR